LESEPDSVRKGAMPGDEEGTEEPVEDIGQFRMDQYGGCYIVAPLLDSENNIREGTAARLYHEDLARNSGGVIAWRLKAYERPTGLAPRIKLIIYDLDGTLIDSAEVMLTILNSFRRKLNKSIINTKNVEKPT
jgi:hypothetical protein